MRPHSFSTMAVCTLKSPYLYVELNLKSSCYVILFTGWQDIWIIHTALTEKKLAAQDYWFLFSYDANLLRQTHSYRRSGVTGYFASLTFCPYMSWLFLGNQFLISDLGSIYCSIFQHLLEKQIKFFAWTLILWTQYLFSCLDWCENMFIYLPSKWQVLQIFFICFEWCYWII